MQEEKEVPLKGNLFRQMTGAQLRKMQIKDFIAKVLTKGISKDDEGKLKGF